MAVVRGCSSVPPVSPAEDLHAVDAANDWRCVCLQCGVKKVEPFPLCATCRAQVATSGPVAFKLPERATLMLDSENTPGLNRQHAVTRRTTPCQRSRQG